ncbi:MAG: tetratricopeptide repeat protein [Pseudomonas sp.]
MKARLFRPLYVLGMGLILTACATSSPPPSELVVIPPVEPTAEPQDATPVVYGNFAKDTLYDLLTAEIAGQRNRYDIALGNYILQARQTRDAGIVERAMRVAEFLGVQEPALDMALLWTEVSPDNPEALRAAALHLARSGRHEEAMQAMEQVLALQGETHFDFLALAAAQTDADSRKAMLQSVQQLREKYPQNAQLVFANALLLQQDQQEEAALALLESYPQSASAPQSTMLHSQLLMARGDTDRAVAMLQEGLRHSPGDNRMRLLLARTLVAKNEFAAAGEQFRVLAEQNPDDPDLLLSLALVNLEAEQFEDAATYFEQLLEQDPENDTARYHLGLAYQELGRPDDALQAWTQVQPGREFLTSRLRISQMLADQQRETELAQQLTTDRARDPGNALSLYLIEIETLSSGQPELAYQRANEALEQFKLDSNLLYIRALLAEKTGRPEQLEADLQMVIDQEPDNSMALNALGYTLADRNVRLDEALKMIERAAKIDPDDPAITDSLGWVHYRLGNLDKAEAYLRKAYAAFPDQEVAAHLGEVLWVRGKRDEARRIWDEALENDPDAPLVHSTRQRLENP